MNYWFKAKSKNLGLINPDSMDSDYLTDCLPDFFTEGLFRTTYSESKISETLTQII